MPFDTMIRPWADQVAEKHIGATLADYERLRARFNNLPPASPGQQKLYLATAGASCSGKTTEMKKLLGSRNDPRFTGAHVCDPDLVLRELAVYQVAREARPTVGTTIRQVELAAYDLARPASIALAHLIMNEAAANGRHIFHGTTGTSNIVPLLSNLEDAGYERRLMLVSTTDHVRLAARRRREAVEGDYHTTSEDFRNKLFAFGMQHSTYFAHADSLDVMWKSDLDTAATLAATYRKGARTVHNAPALDAYVRRYGEICSDAGVAAKPWAQMEEAYALRFKSGSREGLTLRRHIGAAQLGNAP